MRLLLTTGFLGGFTTFSSFSLDAVLLAERGDWAGLAFYVVGSVALSILALILGMRVVAWVW
jgi:CrcB protein